MDDNAIPFHLYPSIDVLDGACVRLLRGDYDAKTEYGQNPAEMAKRWISAGAKWLHVVDLNGAKNGTTDNFDAIREVVSVAVAAGCNVQVGGGIRSYETLSRWLTAGVTRCVIGTAALDPEWAKGAVERFGSDAIVVGLDGRDGKIAVRGWLEQTDVTMVDMARRLADVGVRFALVTDVERDGAMTGANLALTQQVQRESGIHTIASGGIRSMEDVLAAQRAGLAGAIAGRSIYNGSLDVAKTIAELERAMGAGE